LEASDTSDTKYIRNFVGISSDRCRAQGKNRSNKLVNPKFGGFEVHVSIDKAGDNSGTIDVENLKGISRAPPADDTIGDG
jgi:hypothetical protein